MYSLTPSALQEFWRTPTEFPLCPVEVTNINHYMQALVKGKVFSKNQYGESLVEDFAYSEDDSRLLVCAKHAGELKPWSLAFIYVNDNHYVHANVQSYFSEEGMLKDFTLMQEKEWTGGDVFDDYC